MQQYFGGQAVLNRDEDHLKMARFFKASWCDRQKHYIRRKGDIDGNARDMVDEIAGVKNINSSVMFVSWRTSLNCGRRMRDLSHVFSLVSINTLGVMKAPKFYVMF